MITRIFTVALELCLALVATASVIKRYQDYPLQVCPINAVCSEIYRFPSQDVTSSYLNFVNCECPSGMYCPKEPGPQTLNAEANKWYDLCSPVEVLPSYQGRDQAEEVRFMQPSRGASAMSGTRPGRGSEYGLCSPVEELPPCQGRDQAEYGLCSPVEELPPCQGRDQAEEVRVNAADFNGQTYKRIHCTCPRHFEEAVSDGRPATSLVAVTSDSRDAKAIYHLMCNEESYMSKRGRSYGETGNRYRSRFYFYKK